MNEYHVSIKMIWLTQYIVSQTTTFHITNHCVKNVRIRSYSGPHFPVFGLNTVRYSVYLRAQSEYGEIRTRITPNTDTFYAVNNEIFLQRYRKYIFFGGSKMEELFPTAKKKESLKTFELTIKNWELVKWLCRICKTCCLGWFYLTCKK